jgi:hypothetical protein
MRKKLALLVPVALLAAAAFAPGHAAALGACTTEELTGAACQGPDRAPAANQCTRKVWVVRASCAVRVPDGFADNLSVSWHNTSEKGQTTYYKWVVKDPAGNVLAQDSNSSKTPECIGVVIVCTPLSLWNGNGNSNSSITISDATNRVICRIFGTHTKYGAIDPLARNSFACAVN